MSALRIAIPLLLISQSTQLQAIEFSATAIQSVPGRADVSTHLYYSSGRIRKEFFYHGEPVIQILDANKHISLMCFTEQQVCYENKSLEEINIGIEQAQNSPCDGNKKLLCENLGEEVLNGRKAVHWKIGTRPKKVVKKDKKTIVNAEAKAQKVSFQWLDSALGIPVKIVSFNGARSDLIWLGSEIVNNRKTEKWQQLIKPVNGNKLESTVWFDTELKISIKQAFANGNSQELRQIVVEKLSNKLFTLPVGFEKQVIGKRVSNKKSNIQ